MMSTDWDSLLQDVEIRYSKLAGIDGLHGEDMGNHDDVMMWILFRVTGPSWGNRPVNGGGFLWQRASNTGFFYVVLMFAWTWS